MAVWFDERGHATIAAASDRVIPGAHDAGVADYIDGFLGAFTFDPPRIWAGGPFSGRHGGEATFGQWTSLRDIDELAWRTRIEGSNGDPAREINGPVVGLQEQYREGLDALGADFADVPADEQDRRLDAVPAFKALLYAHCCEGMYGDPVYGGNRELTGWQSIDFPGDAQPRGYTDEEVSGAG
jgi:gluconate 2-dehydrogenase gamma chain